MRLVGKDKDVPTRHIKAKSNYTVGYQNSNPSESGHQRPISSEDSRVKLQDLNQAQTLKSKLLK